jgi:hypothetical protein
LKIQSVTATGLFGHRSLLLMPDGASQFITGGNAKGKTSILRTIEAALIGFDDAAIHIDHDEAEVTLRTEAFTITRTKKRGEPAKLEVINEAQNVKVKSPAAYLKRIIKPVAFNPLSFVTAKTRDQRDMLLRTIDLKTDPDSLRADLMLNGATQASVDFLFSTAKPRFDLHALDVFDALYKEAYEVRKIAGALTDNATHYRVVLDELCGRVCASCCDVIKETARVKTCDTNESKASRADMDVVCKLLKDTIPGQLAQDVRFPVPWITATEDSIKWRGIDVAMLSGAERLRLALALVTSQLTNPEHLQLILIDGAECLDVEQDATLRERMATGDVQFIVTRVTEGALRNERIAA